MAQEKITAKQQEILEYIKETILKKGYPPAVREICEAVHLKSTSSVHSHLETLEEKGYIRRDPTKPRTIEIIDDCFNLTRREVVNVPLVGTVAAGGVPPDCRKHLRIRYLIFRFGQPGAVFRMKDSRGLLLIFGQRDLLLLTFFDDGLIAVVLCTVMQKSGQFSLVQITAIAHGQCRCGK